MFDFSPEGLFSSEDVKFAIKNGAKAYKKNIKERLPLFDEYNLFDSDEEDYNKSPDGSVSFRSEDMFNFGEGNKQPQADNYSAPNLNSVVSTAYDFYNQPDEPKQQEKDNLYYKGNG